MIPPHPTPLIVTNKTILVYLTKGTENCLQGARIRRAPLLYGIGTASDVLSDLLSGFYPLPPFYLIHIWQVFLCDDVALLPFTCVCAF
jgi:hypothetical protein